MNFYYLFSSRDSNFRIILFSKITTLANFSITMPNFKGQTICKICNKSTELIKFKMPHAFKLLVDELNVCNVKLEFSVKNGFE
jgi:DNA-directed RNA polymerase beta subunit